MATTAKRGETATGQLQRRGRRVSLTPYLFILPHLLLFIMFLGWPFFYGLFISFQTFDYLRPERTEFIGLANYINLFTPSTVQFGRFWNALGNTFQFVLYSVPLLVIIPLGLAVLLNTKTPGRNIFRAIYFAPWTLSVAVASLLWWWIFQSQGGLVNYYLAAIGLPTPRWLSSMPWGWIAVTVATVWWTAGFNMIILLAALQDIPGHLYEAASIDGATGWQVFWRITLPLLRPVLIFIITTSIIASFNLFGQPFFMTSGGQGIALDNGPLEPVMLQIYREGFVRNIQGSASAMSFVVATIMILVSYLNFRFLRQKDDG
jgi:multiple sugar transport system permease protein